jgi:hypothetical protein
MSISANKIKIPNAERVIVTEDTLSVDLSSREGQISTINKALSKVETRP